MHQWGVEMPGGAEALVHWRGAVETIAKEALIPPVVAFDLDLANMFCNVEWAEIRCAVGKHFDEALKWLEWNHQVKEVVVLPSGEEHLVDRGAGQGDVYGSTSCALALGERMQEHSGRFRAVQQLEEASPSGAVEECFIDEGQAFVRLELADVWLQSVDKAISDLGGHRTQGAGCKSHARLLCTEEFAAAHPDWASAYIQQTCKVGKASDAPKVLGVHVGGLATCSADMDDICSKVQYARDCIQELNSPASELTLQRCCLNVSKAGYLLRCNGDRIDDARLRKFDLGMAAGLESALWAPLSDDAWVQASMVVDAGGLGMRESQSIALPAFVASRVAARPLVAEMARHTAEAGICPEDICMRLYDQRTCSAYERWLGEMPVDMHVHIRVTLDDAADQAAARWRSWCEGSQPPVQQADRNDSVPVAGAGAGIIGQVGSQDVEHPHSMPSSSPMHLQQQLTRLADRCGAQGLVNKFTQQER